MTKSISALIFLLSFSFALAQTRGMETGSSVNCRYSQFERYTEVGHSVYEMERCSGQEQPQGKYFCSAVVSCNEGTIVQPVVCRQRGGVCPTANDCYRQSIAYSKLAAFDRVTDFDDQVLDAADVPNPLTGGGGSLR